MCAEMTPPKRAFSADTNTGSGQNRTMAGQFVLGVDLDGVVADHTRRFREIVAELRGTDPETLSLERSWDFHEWGCARRYDRLHKQAVTEFDMIRTMNVIDGAADALWRLSDAGIWIRSSPTASVSWAHERAVGDTAHGSTTHRSVPRPLVPRGQAGGESRHVITTPHNIVALRELGNDVIVFDQPYNRHIAGGTSDRLDGSRDDRGGPGRRPVWPRSVRLPGINAGSDRLARAASTGLTGERSVTLLKYFSRHRRGDPLLWRHSAVSTADGIAAHALPNL